MESIKISTIFKLLRVNQYLKNLFIFTPIFFAQNFTDIAKIKLLIIAFAAFSLLASSIYILNDIIDLPYDRNHEKKKHRPIASNEISIKSAIIILICLLLISFGLLYFLPVPVYHIFICYILLNLMYSKLFKNIVIIDIITVSVFYFIRIWLGAVIANVELSDYIIIMTFLLAMFLAVSKRYDDLKYIDTRKITSQYTVDFIKMAMTILSAIIILCYIEYTISPETIGKYNCNYLYTTSVFVIIGILRYLQLVFVGDNVYSPTEVCYKDRFMQLTLFLWVLTFIGIIYL